MPTANASKLANSLPSALVLANPAFNWYAGPPIAVAAVSLNGDDISDDLAAAAQAIIIANPPSTLERGISAQVYDLHPLLTDLLTERGFTPVPFKFCNETSPRPTVGQVVRLRYVDNNWWMI